MPTNLRTLDILRHLARKPGHDEVKADFRELLVEEFGVEHSALDFERRVPEVKGRLDALIGRTVFEAKSDLLKEWDDVARVASTRACACSTTDGGCGWRMCRRGSPPSGAEMGMR